MRFYWNLFLYNKFVEGGVMIPCRELIYVWKGPGGGRLCTTLLKKLLGLISMNLEMILRLQSELLWIPLERILITRIKVPFKHANPLATSLTRLICFTFFFSFIIWASNFYSFHLINLTIFAINHTCSFEVMIYVLIFLSDFLLHILYCQFDLHTLTRLFLFCFFRFLRFL